MKTQKLILASFFLISGFLFAQDKEYVLEENVSYQSQRIQNLDAYIKERCKM